MKKLSLAVIGVAGAMFASSAMADGHGNSTLAQVKAKGFVQCGVSQGLPGFSNADDSGEWTGLDVDLCRGVGAALSLAMPARSSSARFLLSSVSPL